MPRTCIRLLALLVPCLIATNALAADIEGTSRIDAVTVYGNGAQVTRVVKAQVSEGTHRVVLTGLPLAMRQQSLRGRGGGESWTLGRVSLVERESSELVRERERELVQEIEALESQQRVRREVQARDALTFEGESSVRALRAGARGVSSR